MTQDATVRRLTTASRCRSVLSRPVQTTHGPRHPRPHLMRHVGQTERGSDWVWMYIRALKEFRELVNVRGERLRALSYGELTELTGAPVEELIIQSRRATIAIIIEPQFNESVRVVVQGFMQPRFLLSTSVALDGFFKNPDGTVSPMPKHEFYWYD